MPERQRSSRSSSAGSRPATSQRAINSCDAWQAAFSGDSAMLQESFMAKLRPYPRILLNAVFVDTYDMVKDPVTGVPPTVAPKFMTNLDNFARTKRATEDERVSFPEN